MREVDDALSRAYAQRAAGGPASGVPPTPHWTGRAPEQDATSPPAGNEPRPSRTTLTRGRTLTWRHHDEPGGDPAQSGSSIEPDSMPELQWPGIVMVLEREWGQRFEQMADRLIEARDRQNMKVLLFTSCHRAEGRTTLVLTLARPGPAAGTDRARRCRPHRSHALAHTGLAAPIRPRRRGDRRARPGRRAGSCPRRPSLDLAVAARGGQPQRVPCQPRLVVHDGQAATRVRPGPRRWQSHFHRPERRGAAPFG